MKYVTGTGDKIQVISLPDDARPISKEDEIVLANRETERLAKEQELAEKAARREDCFQKEKRIAELKRELSRSDYKAIKYAEGEISVEDYAEIKLQRNKWRGEINALEEALIALKNI